MFHGVVPAGHLLSCLICLTSMADATSYRKFNYQDFKFSFFDITVSETCPEWLPRIHGQRDLVPFLYAKPRPLG